MGPVGRRPRGAGVIEVAVLGQYRVESVEVALQAWRAGAHHILAGKAEVNRRIEAIVDICLVNHVVKLAQLLGPVGGGESGHGASTLSADVAVEMRSYLVALGHTVPQLYHLCAYCLAL